MLDPKTDINTQISSIDAYFTNIIEYTKINESLLSVILIIAGLVIFFFIYKGIKQCHRSTVNNVVQRRNDHIRNSHPVQLEL